MPGKEEVPEKNSKGAKKAHQRDPSSYRRQDKGKLVVGTVLIVVGGAHILGMVGWWPLLLIAIGIIIVFSSLKKT